MTAGDTWAISPGISSTPDRPRSPKLQAPEPLARGLHSGDTALRDLNQPLCPSRYGCCHFGSVSKKPLSLVLRTRATAAYLDAAHLASDLLLDVGGEPRDVIIDRLLVEVHQPQELNPG